MGFYADFIQKNREETERWVQMHRVGHCPCPDHEYEAKEKHVFGTIASAMRAAKIIRLGGEQARVFLEHPVVEGQDFVQWLRLPFPRVYMHLDPAIPFSNYLGEIDTLTPEEVTERRDQFSGSAWEPTLGDARIPSAREVDPPAHANQPFVVSEQPGTVGFLGPSADKMHLYSRAVRAGVHPLVRGVVLAQPWLIAVEPEVVEKTLGVPWSSIASVFQVVFLMPVPEFYFNTHIATLFIGKDNVLRWWKGGAESTRERMLQWSIHVLNFLSSPSVKLVGVQPAPALQKARMRRGKEPLPGWYEITYRKHIQEYTSDKISPKAWEHSFRYDVRGHFMRFTRGRMQGRVIWCPPHQRGLKHSLYKPKVYRTGYPGADPEGPVWEGGST